MLFVLIWISWEEFVWAAHFVENAKPGFDIAATITAVTAPLTLLQGYLFKAYDDRRRSGAPPS